MKGIFQYFVLLFFITGLYSCEELSNQTAPPQEQIQQENGPKGPDQPAEKNFSEADLQYKGKPLRLTRHGRCRSECRHIDPYEIQQVLGQNKINTRKTNYNGKPCPAIAYEGKTRDAQFVRVVIGACEDDYRVITVIDLSKDWNCSCK